MCNTVLLDDYLNNLCLAGNLSLQDFCIHYFPQTPNVPHSYLQSKIDIVQRAFYVALAVSEGYDPVITATEFYEELNAVFASYNPARNFLTYLVDGEQHCYTPLQLYYDADPYSAQPASVPTNTTLMYQWVNNFPLTLPFQTASTICEGEIELPPSSAQQGTKNDYCSPLVFPKLFKNID